MELVQATAEMEMAETAAPLWGPAGADSNGQGNGVANKVRDKLTP